MNVLGCARPDELHDAAQPDRLAGRDRALRRPRPRGLPIDVQVVAGPWRDDVALAAALRLEEALGGWRAPPI